MIEKRFDISFVGAMALREKQIQQNYRPVIAVHKWFARRPGTLFRSLLLSEFGEEPLDTLYFRANSLRGIHVADPFMGGGTPLLEANRLGCIVTGYDINPMAYWIVRQEIEHLDVPAYMREAHKLTDWLEQKVGQLYTTRCHSCGQNDVPVKYWLWVKTIPCEYCGHTIDLFPGYLLSENRRHPHNVFVCAVCGELTENEDRLNPGNCRSCNAPLTLRGPARGNTCACPRCHIVTAYPRPTTGPPRHRLFAIEYHCRRCRPAHSGRFFKKPDSDDLARVADAETRWAALQPEFVPNDAIPRGDETDRLLRWGYLAYRDMFNQRQLLGLEMSCRAIARQSDDKIRNALATNLSDLLRYQNMLCRYDTMALKSLDIFSVHGFPVGLVQCESNLLGIAGSSEGVNVGSGGWSNIVEKYARAKRYCDAPFEVRHDGSKKSQIAIRGEWIGEQRNGAPSSERRLVHLHCGSATCATLPPSSVDAVFTDPPYFGNVQYAELMDFCYVWLRRLVGQDNPAFKAPSTRSPHELTGNVTMDRGYHHFTEGISQVFCRMAVALKPASPLAFTYHHNSLEAYLPIAVSLLDACLVCSASLPCPAEMGASIHISGTGSSIVDTIFVCRSTGLVPRRLIVESPELIAGLVADDLEHLRSAGVQPTRGDVRCVIFGHLIRLAIWGLRASWDNAAPTATRLARVTSCIESLGGMQAIEAALGADITSAAALRHHLARERPESYGADADEISF